MKASYRMRGRYDLAVADYRPGDVVEYDTGKLYVFRRGGAFVPLIIEPTEDNPWNESGPQGQDGKDSTVPGPKGDPSIVPGPKGADGKPGMIWQGEWEFSKTYYASDAVHHEGSSYIAIKNNQHQEPGDSLAWEPLALRGEDGKEGSHTTIRHGSPRIVECLEKLKNLESEGQQPETIATTFLSECPMGTPIFLDSEGQADKAQAGGTFEQANVMGLSLGDNRFIASGIVTQDSWSDIVGDDLLIPNQTLYLSLTPGKLTYNSPTSEGQHSVVVAKCVSRTSVHCDVEYPVAL